ncbi:NAD(P)H-binding protein [Micromonospora tarensis]|uniref:NAD(P)H-binding protein n=1 Tax=Micromonospora tarensis TaxID=2806100 RepID=UPI002814C423|nr:NAD(P)H-binding protein [Micromonospora tarensis]
MGDTTAMIMVTGANGQLASRTLQELAGRGAPALGGSRTPTAGQRRVDFDEPASLDLTGVSTVVLVSAGYAEDDRVVVRHRAVLDAAVRDGVAHVVYTSLTGAGDHLGFALAHRATEHLIRASGLGWTVLRNGLYAELFGALLARGPDGLESAFGDGALAAVARADLAEAAAVVASDPTAHVGMIYDLVGDPFTATDVAERLGIAHRTIGLEEYRARLLADDTLLPFQPPMLASIASNVRHGFLGTGGPDLGHLLGRARRPAHCRRRRRRRHPAAAAALGRVAGGEGLAQRRVQRAAGGRLDEQVREQEVGQVAGVDPRLLATEGLRRAAESQRGPRRAGRQTDDAAASTDRLGDPGEHVGPGEVDVGDRDVRAAGLLQGVDREVRHAAGRGRGATAGRGEQRGTRARPPVQRPGPVGQPVTGSTEDEGQFEDGDRQVRAAAARPSRACSRRQRMYVCRSASRHCGCSRSK